VSAVGAFPQHAEQLNWPAPLPADGTGERCTLGRRADGLHAFPHARHAVRGKRPGQGSARARRAQGAPGWAEWRCSGRQARASGQGRAWRAGQGPGRARMGGMEMLR